MGHSVSKDAKKAGHDISKGAKETGHDVSKGAKAIGNSAKKVYNDTKNHKKGSLVPVIINKDKFNFQATIKDHKSTCPGAKWDLGKHEKIWVPFLLPRGPKPIKNNPFNGQEVHKSRLKRNCKFLGGIPMSCSSNNLITKTNKNSSFCAGNSLDSSMITLMDSNKWFKQKRKNPPPSYPDETLRKDYKKWKKAVKDDSEEIKTIDFIKQDKNSAGSSLDLNLSTMKNKPLYVEGKTSNIQPSYLSIQFTDPRPNKSKGIFRVVYLGKEKDLYGAPLSKDSKCLIPFYKNKRCHPVNLTENKSVKIPKHSIPSFGCRISTNKTKSEKSSMSVDLSQRTVFTHKITKTFKKPTSFYDKKSNKNLQYTAREVNGVLNNYLAMKTMCTSKSIPYHNSSSKILGGQTTKYINELQASSLGSSNPGQKISFIAPNNNTNLINPQTLSHVSVCKDKSSSGKPVKSCRSNGKNKANMLRSLYDSLNNVKEGDKKVTFGGITFKTKKSDTGDVARSMQQIITAAGLLACRQIKAIDKYENGSVSSIDDALKDSYTFCRKHIKTIATNTAVSNTRVSIGSNANPGHVSNNSVRYKKKN